MPTLSYSELSQGWPTFYSFTPEWMIGMNNNFYGFKRGNLFKHNDVYSNTMYGVYPIQFNLTFSANKSPLVNKLFKAVSLDSSIPMGISISSDFQNLLIQPSGVTLDADGLGSILAAQFIKKEAMWFSNITIVAPNSTSYRNMTGMGVASVITGSGSSTYTLATPISSIICIGDFYGYVVTTTPGNVNMQIGQITAIDPTRTIVTTSNVLTAPVTGASNIFVFSYKDTNAESYGYLAACPVISVIGPIYVPPALNANQTDELFSIEFDVMKSMP